MIDHLIAIATDPAMAPVYIAAVFAGLARGFAGFGAGLIFIPLASALIDPATAVIMLWIAETAPTLPILLPALKKFSWASVRPVAIGYAIGAPAGVWLLKHTDPTSLRWFMFVLVVALLALLMSGKRYAGAPKPSIGIGVGGLSGFLGGATQLSGPPVLAYWLGGPDQAWRIRANVIVFFAMATILSGAALFAGGLFTGERFMRGITVMPIYMLAIMLGARGFVLATETTFRRIAYGLIALAAILSLPLLDGPLGR